MSMRFGYYKAETVTMDFKQKKNRSDPVIESTCDDIFLHCLSSLTVSVQKLGAPTWYVGLRMDFDGLYSKCETLKGLADVIREYVNRFGKLPPGYTMNKDAFPDVIVPGASDADLARGLEAALDVLACALGRVDTHRAFEMAQALAIATCCGSVHAPPGSRLESRG